LTGRSAAQRCGRLCSQGLSNGTSQPWKSFVLRVTTVSSCRNELIFNNQTAALMGELSTGGTPGSSSWAVYLNTSVVNSLPTPSPLPPNRPCVGTAGHVQNVPGGSVVTGIPSGRTGP
jgi:hypothetical protein